VRTLLALHSLSVLQSSGIGSYIVKGNPNGISQRGALLQESTVLVWRCNILGVCRLREVLNIYRYNAFSRQDIQQV
jgi:hypothetical protein